MKMETIQANIQEDQEDLCLTRNSKFLLDLQVKLHTLQNRPKTIFLWWERWFSNTETKFLSRIRLNTFHRIQACLQCSSRTKKIWYKQVLDSCMFCTNSDLFKERNGSNQWSSSKISLLKTRSNKCQFLLWNLCFTTWRIQEWTVLQTSIRYWMWHPREMSLVPHILLCSSLKDFKKSPICQRNLFCQALRLLKMSTGNTKLKEDSLLKKNRQKDKKKKKEQLENSELAIES